MSEEELKLQIAVMSENKFDFLKILRFVHVDHGVNQVRKYFHKIFPWNCMDGTIEELYIEKFVFLPWCQVIRLKFLN